jgi:hypothetical protein
MTSKEGESGMEQEMLRMATHDADIDGTRASLMEIKNEGDPKFGTAKIMERIGELVVFDGRPLLQENLEEAVRLLDTANAIETTREIVEMRAKVDYEILRISREPHVRHD